MRKGYTLIEALVVLSAVAVIVAAALASFGSFRGGRNLDRDRQGVVAALRSAQSKAMSGAGDAPWGVVFAAGTYVLYKGPAYDPASPDDVPYRLSGSSFAATSVFAASGGGTSDRVLFDKLRGSTPDPGTITLVGADGTTATVAVTAAGGIE